MDQENTDLAPADEPRALSDILGRAEPAERREAPAGQQAQSTETPTAPETGEAAAQRARDEAGRFAPKPEAAPPAASNPEVGQLAALKAEREKRQALERRLAEYEARQAPQAAPPPAIPPTPEPAAPAFWDDPEKFVGSVEQRVAAMVEERTAALRMEWSREQTRTTAQDYDDAEQALFDHVQEARASRDPVKIAQADAIAAAIRNAPNPAAVALQLGRQAKALREAGNDPQAMYERAVQAEVEKRIAAMQPAAPASPDPASPAPRLPTSLASARAAAPRAASTYQGPKPFAAILGQRR